MGAQITVSFRDPAGVAQRIPLARAAGLPFFDYLPVRVPPSYRGQRHWSGLYWCATTRTFIPYESRLELSRLLLLDFDPAVVAVGAQPFRLHFVQGAVEHSHVPDFFLRLTNGRERVVDVKPARQLLDPKVRPSFDATREACCVTGWDYQVQSEPDAVLLENVRWLAGFRRPIHDRELSHVLSAPVVSRRPLGV